MPAGVNIIPNRGGKPTKHEQILREQYLVELILTNPIGTKRAELYEMFSEEHPDVSEGAFHSRLLKRARKRIEANGIAKCESKFALRISQIEREILKDGVKERDKIEWYRMLIKMEGHESRKRPNSLEKGSVDVASWLKRLKKENGKEG